MSKSSHNRAATSRVKRGRDFTSVQPDLFQRLEEPAEPQLDDLDINAEFLGACNTAIREAKARGMSRERIVDEMNRLLPDLPRPLTLRQLNAWTAASQSEFKPFPARYLAAFCAATQCDAPLRALSEPIGRDLVDAREIAALRLGQSLVESARLKREQQFLKRRLGG